MSPSVDRRPIAFTAALLTSAASDVMLSANLLTVTYTAAISSSSSSSKSSSRRTRTHFPSFVQCSAFWKKSFSAASSVCRIDSFVASSAELTIYAHLAVGSARLVVRAARSYIHGFHGCFLRRLHHVQRSVEGSLLN
jgi:hypothetical protein